jgi:hypothetical protein
MDLFLIMFMVIFSIVSIGYFVSYAREGSGRKLPGKNQNVKRRKSTPIIDRQLFVIVRQATLHLKTILQKLLKSLLVTFGTIINTTIRN